LGFGEEIETKNQKKGYSDTSFDTRIATRTYYNNNYSRTGCGILQSRTLVNPDTANNYTYSGQPATSSNPVNDIKK